MALPTLKLINVSGDDKAGISASLLGIIAEHGGDVLDIGQAVIHDTLSLGILVRVDDMEWSTAAKELLYCAYEMEIKIKFSDISAEQYSEWVKAQGKDRHIVTLLGHGIHTIAMAKLAAIFRAQGLSIDHMTRLSGRVPLDAPSPPIACVELSVRGTPKDAAGMREELTDLAHELGVDIGFQADNIYRRNRRLVCFDMDSTLIQTEVIDELAEEAGVREQVSAVTEAAMRGELDFKESLRQRLAHLEGLPESVLERIAQRLPLSEGAERLVSMLNHLGYSTAIISGGFTYFGHYLQKRLGIDYVFANELEIVDGKLTGHVIGGIVDGARKAEIVRELAEREGITLEQVIAVGDGANDLPMLGVAGLGIAFRAKPVVAESASHAISAVGLDGILYLLGMRDRDTFDHAPRG